MSDQRQPRQVADAVVSRRGMTSTLVAGGRSIELNGSALAIWELCDGITTVDEMVGAVVELTGIDEDHVAVDVAGVVEQFGRLGLVTFGG
jgi:hypothetical protein